MIKRFKVIGIIFSILFIVGLFMGYQYQIRSLKKRIVNVRAKYVKQWERDSTALVVKAEVIDSLKDLYLSSMEVSAHWKNECFKIKDAKQETVYIDSVERYKVLFYTSNECVEVSGYTLMNPPEAFFDITNIPDNIYIDLGYVDEDWVVSRIKIERNCINIDDIKVGIPPDLNIDNMGKKPGTIKLIGSFIFGVSLSWLIFR